MEDWGAVKARLVAYGGLFCQCGREDCPENKRAADIRAALERVEEYHDEALAAVKAEADALTRKREIAAERDALRQRVKELEHTAARNASEAAWERLRAEAAEQRVRELEAKR